MSKLLTGLDIIGNVLVHICWGFGPVTCMDVQYYRLLTELFTVMLSVQGFIRNTGQQNSSAMMMSHFNELVSSQLVDVDGGNTKKRTLFTLNKYISGYQ